MKISKNDWSYKIQVNNGTYPEYRTNLCSYMRGLIIASVLELTKKILIPIWLITSPFFFIYYILVDTISTTGFEEVFYAGLFWLAFCGIMIDIMITIDIIMSYLPKRKWKENKEKIKKENRPNILLEYLKAKKEKICPIIEFEEELK